MQGPVPDQFNLIVTDMDATVAFYRKLGLTIPDTDPQWQHHHRTATTPGRDRPRFGQQRVRRVLEPRLAGRHGGARVQGR